MVVDLAWYITIIVAILLILALAYQIKERRNDARQLKETQQLLVAADVLQAKTSDQLQAILKVSHKFIEAGDEEEIIETVLQLSMELTGAMGSSFVPLDERSQPKSAIRKGIFPFPIPDAWLEYLASTAVRESCRQCSLLENHDHTCSLIAGPFSETIGIYCFPVRYGEHELGMINLHMPGSGQMPEQTKISFQALVDASALAMESARLRERELATLSQLHAVPAKNDLKESLVSMVRNLYETLAADVALLVLNPKATNLNLGSNGKNQLIDRNAVLSGDLGDERAAFESLARDVIEAGIMQTSDSAGITIPTIPSWIAVPMVVHPDQVLGVLVVASRRTDHIHNRHIVLVQGVAEQMSLLIENTTHLADLEYKIMMEERTRLAREIHDGLAQTLGFLKLQVAQMLSYIGRGDQDRLEKAIHLSYESLAAAYNDARQAIDGLRVRLNGDEDNYLESWLRQTIEEFCSTCGTNAFTITLEDVNVKAVLPPEVHAQLIRIVQEALSNIRKHANATQAWISCHQSENDIILEVRDNGQGFAVTDVHGLSRYGLRGMRERAELIGADFQVISRPTWGTTVTIRLPLQLSKGLEV